MTSRANGHSTHGRAALTHVDATGRPGMVDVSPKPETSRLARAEGVIVTAPATLAALRSGAAPKGDPLVVARIAGIQAAKRTADLIPLCHPLTLDHAAVDLAIDDELPGVRVTAVVTCHGRTGVEMEALTAVAVALLTIYDMLKAIDGAMRIEAVRVVEKQGGTSGRTREPAP